MVADRIVMAACKLHGLFFGEEARVAAADDERYLACAAVAAGVVPDAIGSSSVFCNEWLCLCAQFYVFLESVAADRLAMAA